jgi:hypothetical protein
MAMDPNNVKFIRGKKAHLAEHDGNWRNPTSGPLIDRLTKFGGSALLAFFMAYDNKLQELLGECDVCFDNNSWLTIINPVNSMLESIALLYGLNAAVEAENNNSEDEDLFTPYSAENQDAP